MSYQVQREQLTAEQWCGLCRLFELSDLLKRKLKRKAALAAK